MNLSNFAYSSLKSSLPTRNSWNRACMRQEAVVRTVGGDSDPGVIGRGIRQGCPISSLLFSIYADVMMIEALEDMDEGVSVGGQLVSDVRLAEDQGMVAGTEMGLQRLMNKL